MNKARDYARSMIVILQFLFNAAISAVIFAVVYAKIGPEAYFVMGLVVATILARKQFARHCEIMRWKATYLLIWLYDIVLWPASIIINLRQAYAGAERDT
jgi:hypothetical protein